MNKNIAIKKIRNPRKYDCVIGYPGEFDAAEFLLEDWDELGMKDKAKVRAILIRSGRYQ